MLVRHHSTKGKVVVLDMDIFQGQKIFPLQNSMKIKPSSFFQLKNLGRSFKKLELLHKTSWLPTVLLEMQQVLYILWLVIWDIKFISMMVQWMNGEIDSICL